MTVTTLINPYRFGGSTWTPLTIAGCNLWLDADDAATITSSSGAVSQWNDKSGNGLNATQGTAARKPTLGTDGTTGRGKISFDGTQSGNGDWLEINDSALLEPSAITVAIACNLTTLDDFSSILTKDGTTWTTAWNMSRSGSSLYFIVNGGASKIADSPYTGRHVFGGSKNGTGNVKGYLDSSTIVGNVAVGSTLTQNANKLYIGGSGHATNYNAAVDIYEVLLYNTELSSGDLGTVCSYLKTKWATT